MGAYDEIDVRIRGQIKPVGNGEKFLSNLKAVCDLYDLEIEYNW